MCVCHGNESNDDGDDDDEGDDDENDVDLELFAIQSGKAYRSNDNQWLALGTHRHTHTRTQREETIERAVRELLLCMRTRHTKREKEAERKRDRERENEVAFKRVLETLITWSCWRVTSSPSLFFALRFSGRREWTETANGDGDVDEDGV